MERLNSIEELRALEERIIADRNPYLPVIVISAGTCGQASGVNDLIRIAKREILANGLAGAVGLRITGCHGFCQAEPSILVEPDGTFYPKLGVNEVARVVHAVSRGSQTKHRGRLKSHVEDNTPAAYAFRARKFLGDDKQPHRDDCRRRR